MRKIISLGLFALMLSIFSSQVFAGKIGVCEEIKDNPAYKGLYGLCNAYWNEEDEDARAQILANFVRKAGTSPGMPGWEPDQPDVLPACPCWDFDTVVQYIACSSLPLDDHFLDPTEDQSGFDFAVFQFKAGSIAVHVWAGYTPIYYDDAHECFINVPAGEGKVPYKETSENEDLACRLDVLKLIEPYILPEVDIPECVGL